MLDWLRVNVWVCSISKSSDASKLGCRVRGKELEEEKRKTPSLEDDWEPEKHSDRSCRTGQIRLHGGGSAISSQRDSESFLYRLGRLLFFSFSSLLVTTGERTKMRDGNHHGQQQGPPLGYSGIDSFSSARLLPSLFFWNLLLHISIS